MKLYRVVFKCKHKENPLSLIQYLAIDSPLYKNGFFLFGYPTFNDSATFFWKKERFFIQEETLTSNKLLELVIK